MVAPLPGRNQVDALGSVSSSSLARDLVDAHKKAVEANRGRDLISEKLLLHIDGSGDFQWADIAEDARVEIPRLVSEFRKTENVLRLIVDNAVAHHTTMPLRYFADSNPDYKARQRAMVDTIWANHLAHEQDFNGLFAEALYLAMPAGFCPVHCYWRDDVPQDWFEAIGYGGEDGAAPAPDAPPGMIDCWVGNPWGTFHDISAKRSSVRWCSYERWLPADLVRQHFGHIPGVAGLEGTDRVPSTAEFQMIARNWRMAGLGYHGSPVISHRRHTKGEEVMCVLCRETAPGADPRYPEGRLQIVLVPGMVDPRRGEGQAGHAIMVADQPLPGGDFSWTNFYSSYRGSDVRGKPWVEDIDQLQVDLNIAKSKRWEWICKMFDSPIVAPGGAITEDMADLDGYNLLEIEPSLGSWHPRVMEWPQQVLAALDNEISELRQAIYTGGGYQAVSRGESPGSRMAYRAIVALQQADNTIHSPVNMRFRRSATDFMGRCWRQMKAYGDVPWLVSILGDEYADLAAPYIDKTKLSDRPPAYKLVNAFGASPELRAEEIVQLMQTKGADGEPFLLTSEARRQYPDQKLFGDRFDPAAMKRRRARTVAGRFHSKAEEFRQQTGFRETGMAHPWVQAAGNQIFQDLEGELPRMRDDDLQASIDALSEITQDETADPIARTGASLRLDQLYMWQAQMAAPMAGAPGAAPAPGGEAPAPDQNPGAREIAADMQRGGGRSVDQGPRNATAARG